MVELNPALLQRMPRASDMWRTDEAIQEFGKPNTDPKLSVPGQRLSRIQSPFTLRLYERKAAANLRFLSVHEKIAPYVLCALGEILKEYGSDRIVELGLDVYAGCYNPRPIRGGTDWSKHAFAIALDWLPGENGLHTPFEKATFSKPEYKPWLDIWQQSGFLNLGRVNTYGRDAMHVEFMNPAKWGA